MVLVKELYVDKLADLKEEVPADCQKVAVFGMGFVGLPLALSFSLRGCDVTGVDVLNELVNELNQGTTHHMESFHNVGIREILQSKLSENTFKATTNPMIALDNCNNFIVTVGIPVKNGIHDMTHLEAVCKTIANGLKRGDTVVIRGTMIPGTTEEFIMPLLEESGFKAGTDFYLAYASERIAEGRAFEEFENMPSLVAGIDEKSALRAKQLLGIVTKAPIHIASCIKVVETAKVMENVQRDVNIAMVQEFARFCEKLDIDTFEVIEMANTHKRVNLLYPGPGVGGYCLPNAMYYLKPKAEELGVSIDLLKTARKINDGVPAVIVKQMEDKLAEKGKKLAGAKIAVLGLAMKDYSNDDRISPPVEIVKLLLGKGAIVKAYDPAVPTKYDFKVDSMEECLKDADGVMILINQKGFENLYHLIQKNNVIIDLRMH